MSEFGIFGNTLTGLFYQQQQDRDLHEMQRSLMQHIGDQSIVSDMLKQATSNTKQPVEVKRELPVATIEEVHAEFDSATERTLQMAKEILEEPEIDKNGKLFALSRIGFKNAVRVKESIEQQERKEIATKHARLVNKYFRLYPFNKFITDEELTRICKKYGLIIGSPEEFIGKIPEKNQMEILGFKPKMSFREKWHEFWNKPNTSDMFVRNYKTVGTPDQFDMYGKYVDPDTQELKIVDPDPVVLYEVDGGFVIVSKWGAEADIEDFE